MQIRLPSLAALVLLLALVSVCLPHAAAAGGEIPSPEAVFGHPMGADRKLEPYPAILDYLETVAASSDRISIEAGNPSTLGNPMPVVVLTSERNQRRLDRLREIARTLALPYGLDAGAVRPLIEEGVAVALVTCTIHSTEVGCTQMAAEFVHEFATTSDPDRIAWMDDAVLLLMPSINPDGQLLVGDWYRKWLETSYEGGRMPWLYHHYIGHDNNRDFYMLTQKESREVNRLLYHHWFPQVFLDEHQMGSVGPRMFVPPQTDPLAPEVHSLVFRQADLLGTNMGRRLEEAGKRGVGNNMIFDSYWPGGTRNTAWWKNVTGLLTEVASARLATPIYVEPGELRGGSKGLPEYTRRANYPSPWEGGWWRLRDVVEYELVATWAYLESVAENHSDILRNMHTMAAESIARGTSEPPYAFIFPPQQHDPAAAAALIDLLVEHGVRVERATGELRSGYRVFPAGTVVVPADQPYRPFLLTMLRPQRYPEVRAYTDGPVIPPYDVTSWSLPISMGVDVVEALEPLTGTRETTREGSWRGGAPVAGAAGHVLPHSADTVFTAMNRLLAQGHRVYWLREDGPAGRRGDVFVPGSATSALAAMTGELHLPVTPVETVPDAMWETRAARIGLFKPWVASMDEGWTRWLLERYGFPHINVANEELRSGAFTEQVDVLLFPDVAPSIIARGRPLDREGKPRPFTPLPYPYGGGIDDWDDRGGGRQKEKGRKKADGEGRGGGERIREWVEQGGTVIALDSSADYFIELFELPVKNVLAKVTPAQLDCPGSMLRLEIDDRHPLAFGMRPVEAGYFARSPAFATRVPDARFRRRVVARYPDDAKDLLVSGFIRGGERLEKRAAMVEFGVGAGRVILIGFRAQHRAQPHRTFKLLFNGFYTLE